MKLERQTSASPIALQTIQSSSCSSDTSFIHHAERPGKADGENNTEKTKLLRGLLFSWVFLPLLNPKKSHFECLAETREWCWRVRSVNVKFLRRGRKHRGSIKTASLMSMKVPTYWSGEHEQNVLNTRASHCCYLSCGNSASKERQSQGLRHSQKTKRRRTVEAKQRTVPDTISVMPVTWKYYQLPTNPVNLLPRLQIQHFSL